MSLNEYNKVTIPAISGNSITLEVNFSKDPEDKNLVKVNGHDTIKMEDLYRFLLVVGTPEMQTELLPVRKTEVTHFMKFHNVEVKRDIKRGERLKVRCEFSVPTSVVEGLSGLVDKKSFAVPERKTSSLYLP